MSTALRHKSNIANNNRDQEEWETSSINSKTLDEDTYVERVLHIANMKLSILPNGGTGDCLFKAISQAIFDDDESEHFPIREKIVSYIVDKTWDKYQTSVQVQHINGRSELQKAWEENPALAYKNYMLKMGISGSFSELNAAAELFRFNFVTLQEYNNNLGMTYRVENSKLFSKHRVPTHYFLFTGDFDNGHWEVLKQRSNGSDVLKEGTYSGTVELEIDNQICSMEFWLMENTQIGQQVCDDIPHTAYIRKKSLCPFDCPELRFESDKTIDLDIRFVITQTKHCDLFSVLSTCHLRNENLARDMHDILTSHRVSNFAALNYKLITQPHSHGFTVEALKYASQSYKGNIQDLLSAGDLYGFSFTIYMILSDRLHSCKFVHVDKWGAEVNKMEYFFLKILPYEQLNTHKTKLKSHWFHLVPVRALHFLNSAQLGAASTCSSPTSAKSASSSIIVDCEKIAENISLDNKNYIKRKAKRMYNLYFDRQLSNPIEETESIKGKTITKKVRPSTPDTSSVPNTKKMKNRSKVKVRKSNSSNYIDIQSLTAKVFQSYNSSRHSKNSVNQLHNSRKSLALTENPMKPISSLEIGMTPSTLLSLRESIYNANMKNNEETITVEDILGTEKLPSRLKEMLRCSSKITPEVTQSGSDLGHSFDSNNEFRYKSVLRGKSDAELLLRRKSRDESWSQRASTFFRFSNASSKVDRVISPISQQSFSSSSRSSRTLCASDEGEGSKENIKKVPVEPCTLSVLTIHSDHERPFMGLLVEERMRKESADDRAESLYSLRSCFNSEEEIHAENMSKLTKESNQKKGCLKSICIAIGSICQ